MIHKHKHVKTALDIRFYLHAAWKLITYTEFSLFKRAGINLRQEPLEYESLLSKETEHLGVTHNAARSWLEGAC